MPNSAAMFRRRLSCAGHAAEDLRPAMVVGTGLTVVDRTSTKPHDGAGWQIVAGLQVRGDDRNRRGGGVGLSQCDTAVGGRNSKADRAVARWLQAETLAVSGPFGHRKPSGSGKRTPSPWHLPHRRLG